MDHDWTSPLPDLSRPAIRRRVKVDERVFTLLLSPVQRDVDGEEDTGLVQLAVLLDGRPVAPRDLGVEGAVCSNLWSYLCTKLTEATVEFYAPRSRRPGEPNPRLGCWGIRPDLVEAHPYDDCGLVAVIGISTWTVGAKPMGGDLDYLEALAGALVRSLAYWVRVAERDGAAGPSTPG